MFYIIFNIIFKIDFILFLLLNMVMFFYVILIIYEVLNLGKLVNCKCIIVFVFFKNKLFLVLIFFYKDENFI